MDIYMEEEEDDMEIDYEASELAKKQHADDLTDMTNKNSRVDSPTLFEIDNSSSCLTAKQKPSIKGRRPPNAFMLFAKEQRRNLDLSALKEKKCHVNAMLGNMWRDLSDFEKTKYLEEARRLLSLYKKSESSSYGKIMKKKRRVRFKLPENSMEKSVKIRGSCKKKNALLPKTGAKLRIHKADDIKKSVRESDSKKSDADKTENTGSNHPLAESCTVNEFPNSSFQHQHSMTKSHSHNAVPPSEFHHSKYCCGQSEFPPNYMGNYKQSTSLDLGMPRSCFAAGFSPSVFPSYPFHAPFWMYQQAMAQNLPSPLPLPPLPSPLPYSYSSPYFYNSTYNSSAYFNSYSSLYSGSVLGPTLAEPYPTSSAIAASSSITRQESTTKSTENSVDVESIEKDPHHSERNQEKTS